MNSRRPGQRLTAVLLLAAAALDLIRCSLVPMAARTRRRPLG